MTLLVPRLPEPSGSYAVGFYDGTFVCDGPEGSEEIAFRCFYPAQAVTGAPASYYPDPQMVEMQLTLPLYQSFAPLLGAIAEMPTHSYGNAPVAEYEAEFPVVVYSHGYMSFHLSNLVQHEELASRGYVVFALSHPGDAFCTILGDGSKVGINNDTIARATDDNIRFMQKIGKTDPGSLTLDEISDYLRECHTMTERVEAWARHTVAAFDEIERIANDPRSPLYKRLDTAGFGLFGHSLGGASSLHTALLDKRVRAAANLDGWQYGAGLLNQNIPAPGLVISTSDHHLPANFQVDDPNLTHAIIPGSTHWFYCDMAVVANEVLKAVEPTISVDGPIVSTITSDLLSAFFDQHVRQDKNASLQTAASRHPREVILQLQPS